MSNIRALFGAAKQNGLDETGIRDIMASLTGTDTLKGHAPGIYRQAIDKMGGTNKPAPKKAAPQLNKVRALWCAAYNLGIAQQRGDKAMNSFIKRQTGIDHANWVHSPDDFKKVIEALKAWMRREGGVDWSLSFEQYEPYGDHARVAYALLCQLHQMGEIDDTPLKTLKNHIARHFKGTPNAPAWYEYHNQMGDKLRAARKAVQ
jgi:hypothetical protein